jgi:integrase
MSLEVEGVLSGALKLQVMRETCTRHRFPPDCGATRLLDDFAIAGREVGLVAKLMGHANANVTLSHYMQAMRGGENAVAALEKAVKLEGRRFDCIGLG